MKRTFVSLSVAFFVGLLVGCSAIFLFMRSELERSQSVHVAASAASHVAALYPLRVGDTNTAVSRLETLLDGDTLVLASMSQGETVTNALAHIRDYRTKHPFSSGDRQIDTAVQTILSKVETK